LSNDTDALTAPSGTALKPGFLAAAICASRSIPALANRAFALSFWIQPIAAERPALPSALSATCCAPVQLDCTTFQP